jgi:hypothetical protein
MVPPSLQKAIKINRHIKSDQITLNDQILGRL